MAAARGAWLRDRGWWLPHEDPRKPTHLLLDGGKVLVPDDEAGAFLNAYTIAVVKQLAPAVVELRTPVFKLFMDLDVKTVRAVRADADAQGALDFQAVVTVIQRRAAAFFEEDTPRAVVCDTPPTTATDGVTDVTKAGRHLVWTNIRVRAPVALAFRTAVIDDLERQFPEACARPWDAVVDKCVFTSNGLRMPWSTKGRGGAGTYTPCQVWVAAEGVAVDPPAGVAAMREWVRELSIREFGVDETPVRPGVEMGDMAGETGEGGETGGALNGTAKRVAEYATVLQELVRCLPPDFHDATITGIMQTDACFLLRSSSQFCLNRGGRHNSCGTFYVLTLKGIRQKCWCRCETTDNRAFGMCMHYGSDFYAVPDHVLRAFFGADAALPGDFKPAVLPSARRSSEGLGDLLGRCRPPLKAPARAKRTKAR